MTTEVEIVGIHHKPKNAGSHKNLEKASYRFSLTISGHTAGLKTGKINLSCFKSKSGNFYRREITNTVQHSSFSRSSSWGSFLLNSQWAWTSELTFQDLSYIESKRVGHVFSKGFIAFHHKRNCSKTFSKGYSHYWEI